MQNNNQGSILLPMVMMTALVFVLLIAGWQLAESDFQDIVPIENVEIEGRFEKLSLSDIQSKVITVLDGGYFTINLNEIRQSLLELPWVEDASIRRQWPSGLHIKVVEKQAVANWGKTMLLSQRGDLFAPREHTPDPDLPMLEGPEKLHTVVWSFFQKLEHAFEGMHLQVNQVKLDQRRAWSLYIQPQNLNNEIEVKLGREDIENRLARFVNAFSNQSKLVLVDIQVIDLRYPNGFAMRKQNTDKTNNNKNTGLVSEVYTA